MAVTREQLDEMYSFYIVIKAKANLYNSAILFKAADEMRKVYDAACLDQDRIPCSICGRVDDNHMNDKRHYAEEVQ